MAKRLQSGSEIFENAAYARPADTTTKGGSRLEARVVLVVAMLLLGGCVEKYESTTYATVPVRTFTTPHGAFEVLDRRDIERLAIRRISECQEHTSGGDLPVPLKAGVLSAECSGIWNRATRFATGLVPKIPEERREIDSTGSTFVLPLQSYFANSDRDCKLVRGHPLVGAQWEFVYNCQPGSDPSKVIWGPNGYSQLWPR